MTYQDFNPGERKIDWHIKCFQMMKNKESKKISNKMVSMSKIYQQNQPLKDSLVLIPGMGRDVIAVVKGKDFEIRRLFWIVQVSQIYSQILKRQMSRRESFNVRDILPTIANSEMWPQNYSVLTPRTCESVT